MDHRCLITTPGRQICDSCLAGLRRDLLSLPGLYDGCGAVLAEPGGGAARERRGAARERRGAARERSGAAWERRGAARERLAAGPAVQLAEHPAAGARTAIQAVLTSWAAVVANEWRLPPPEPDVPALVAFLRLHLDWLASHSGAALLVEDTGELAARAWRVLDAGLASRSA